MSKRQIFMIIGAWMIVDFFLGFPPFWNKIFSVIAGILVIGIAYSMAPHSKPEQRDIPFAEHKSETITNTEPTSSGK